MTWTVATPANYTFVQLAGGVDPNLGGDAPGQATAGNGRPDLSLQLFRRKRDTAPRRGMAALRIRPAGRSTTATALVRTVQPDRDCMLSSVI